MHYSCFTSKEMKSSASLRLSKDSSVFRAECQIQVVLVFAVVVLVWFFLLVQVKNALCWKMFSY